MTTGEQKHQETRRHFAAAAGDRCLTEQVPCRYTGAGASFVTRRGTGGAAIRRLWDLRNNVRSIAYMLELTGFLTTETGRDTFFTDLGVAALLTARIG